MVDEKGHELPQHPAEREKVAGTVADAPEPGTKKEGDVDEAKSEPASVNVQDDLKKEASVDSAAAVAEPASDASVATKDEL